jgi:uncharacterized membrane protein
MVPAAAVAENKPQQPKINEITLDHPWEWLAKGWKDLRHSLKFSLAYGSVYVIVSYLLTFGLVYKGLFFIIPPLLSGFFLVAPVLGIGLYHISESLELGETVQFCNAVKAWKRNEVHLSAMAIVLVLVVLVWMLAALVSFALFYDQPVPTWENFIPDLFLSARSPVFLFAGILMGGFIAAFAFSISAVSVPMLMDRKVDVVTAMHTSLRAVRMNWQAMTLWACLIVMFVGAGIATFYIGLIVWMPLVGHATWHAYRDLVPAEEGAVTSDWKETH